MDRQNSETKTENSNISQVDHTTFIYIQIIYIMLYLYGLTFSTFKFLIYFEVEQQEEIDAVLFFLYGYLSVPY